jgi:arylsulfatase A-like enzyme
MKQYFMSRILNRIISINKHMIKMIGVVVAILFLSIHATSAQKIVKQRPNIIVFLVDDMGWLDTSVPFWTNKTNQNKTFRTPNMELLAAEGMKFTNAYANPVCTPSRVSMLTGVSAAKHHVINWTSPFKNNNTDNVDEQMGSAKWNMNGLSNVADIPFTFHATAFPSLLKSSGYFTVHVGKAHWGSSGTPGSNPYNLGFMVNISGQSSGHPQSYLGEENYGNVPMKPTIQAVSDLQEYHGSNTFLTEALTKEALKTLDAPIQQGQPFFLHLSHYAVHVPLQADSRFVKRYLEMGLDSAEANYASLVEGMDKSLGDVMNYLKEKKVDQNTIILFMSDNGGFSLSGKRIRAKESHTQNLPLKAGKGSVYEGGVRIPFIVKWPGIAQKGAVTAAPVIVDDLFPTIMEMAGIKKYNTIQSIDGKSMVDVIRKPAINNERTFIWHYPVKWTTTDGPGINFHSAIRKGDWKLIYNMRNGQSELYNLKEDIGELNDRSNYVPEILKELKSSLSDSLRKWSSPMPVFKSTNKTVPMPDEL